MKLPKNNESTTVKSDASELGPPTPKDAALANVGTKIVNKSECVKRLGELFVKTACFFVLLQNLSYLCSKIFKYLDMTTRQMSAELFRQLSIIAEDKNLMTKLLRYARKLTATKADSSKMSEEEFFARVDEAKEEIRQGEGIRFSDPVAMKEWLNSL